MEWNRAISRVIDLLINVNYVDVTITKNARFYDQSMLYALKEIITQT